MIQPSWFGACATSVAQALFVSGLFSFGPAVAEPAPDVIVLVTVGGLRADVLQYPAELPELARVAASGARFIDASSPSPQSLPALASVLTGRPPIEHGVPDAYTAPLSDDIETIAERLHGAGYATVAFPGDPLLNRTSGFSRGFTSVDWFAPTRTFAARVDSAATRLAAADGPTFLWIDSSRVGARRPWERVLAPSPIDAASYRLSLSDLDVAVGRLWDVVAARDDVLFVLTGTHGWTLGNDAGIYGSGLDLAPTSLDVPLIVSGPGVTPRAVSGAVSTTDIAPTLAVLAGIGDDIDVSLVDALGGGGVPTDRVLTHETDVSRLTNWPPLIATRGTDGVVRARETDDAFDPRTRPDVVNGILAARRLAAERQSQRAVAVLDSLVRATPDNGLLHIELGFALTFTRQEQAASQLMDGIIQLHPHWVEMQAAYMEALLRFNRHQPAITSLNRAEPSTMFEAERLWSLGSFQAGALEFDDAIETFGQALRVGPPTSPRWQKFWESLPLLDSYAAELEIEPDSFVANLELGKLFGDLDMYVDAYKKLHVARGLVLAPSEADYWMGHYLLRERRPQHAIVSFRRALEYDDRSSSIWSGFGVAKLQLGDADSAYVAFERAVELGEADAVTMYNYACFLSRDGRLDDAVAWLGRAVDDGYSNREVLRTDTDLDPLRERDDFVAILHRVGLR